MHAGATAKRIDPAVAEQEARDLAFERAREARLDRAQRAVDAEQRSLGLRADLLTAVHFDVGQADIPPKERPSVDQKVAILRANPRLHVRIEGGADDFASTTKNRALSMRRAAALRDYFAAKGIARNRVTISVNEEDAVACAVHMNACSSENRRDDLVITDGGDSVVSP